MPTIRRNAGIGAVAALALMAAAGIGIASGALSSGHAAHHYTVSLPRTLVRRAAANRAVLVHNFAFLTEARASSATAKALPSDFAEELTRDATKPVPAGGLSEPDPSMAVYLGTVVTTARGTLSIWAMPGANDLCLATMPSTGKGGSVQCASDQEAAAGQLMGADERSTGIMSVVGLVPGSPKNVTVHHRDGSSDQVPATNGLWVVNNDPQVASVSGGSLSGRASIPPLPGSSR